MVPRAGSPPTANAGWASYPAEPGWSGSSIARRPRAGSRGSATGPTSAYAAKHRPGTSGLTPSSVPWARSAAARADRMRIRAEATPSPQVGPGGVAPRDEPALTPPAAAGTRAAPARIISATAPSLGHYADPIAMARNLYAHRDLIWRFALRDVQGRYKGSYLGMLWSFITPLLMLSVYTFVFGVVLRTRWDGQTGNGSLEFSLIMFSGLIVFSVFSDCLARAPALIIGSPNYVKTVVFPLEVLPASVLVSSLIQAGISLAVLLAGSMVFLGRLSVTL